MKIDVDKLGGNNLDHFWELLDDDVIVENDFFKLKNVITTIDKSTLENLIESIDLPVCACHSPEAEKFPWWLMKFDPFIENDMDLMNTRNYLLKNKLLTYSGRIMLETRDELNAFMNVMVYYPEKVHYLNIYLFCSNNMIIEINHHSTMLVYSRA